MLFPKLSCVCISCIKSVAPRVCLVKVPFCLFFGPDIKSRKGCGHYMYFKHSTDNIDSKYILVHRSNSLGSSVFVKIPLFGILTLHK